MSEPEMLTLRYQNTQVPEPVVRATMINLEDFSQREPIAFYELACMCQDPGHVPFGNTGNKLRAAGFVDGSKVQATIRVIVLSALHGDGDVADGSMYLGSPLAED